MMKILNLFYSKKRIARIAAHKSHEKEVQRIKGARAYINKWDDMPMNLLQDEVFKILDLPINKGCKDFLTSILIRNDIDQLARDLKLQRDFHSQTVLNELIDDAKN